MSHLAFAGRYEEKRPRLKLMPHAGYELVLAEVAKGRSVTGSIRRLRRRGVRTPNVSRFFQWGAQTPERYELFARVIETKTEVQLDELEHILEGAFIDEDGNNITDPAMIAVRLKAAEAKVKLRQWRAAKAMPHKWGDKIHHEHSGGVAIAVVTGVTDNLKSDNHRVIEDSAFGAEAVIDVPHRLISDSDDDDIMAELCVARAGVERIGDAATSLGGVAPPSAIDFE